MTEFKPIKEGKVREIYDNGDSLIMVATDRISAFDVILKNKVTNKGKVLTQMSKFWFDYTRDLLPNHMLSVDVKEMLSLIHILVGGGTVVVGMLPGPDAGALVGLHEVVVLVVLGVDEGDIALIGLAGLIHHPVSYTHLDVYKRQL